MTALDDTQRLLLTALVDKYRCLRELRQRATGSDANEARAQMSALAKRFPGALRELDQLPMALIETRLAALCAVLEGRSAPQRWMLLQCAYHGQLRAALRIKQQLRAYAGSAPSLELALAGYQPAADEPGADSFDLAAIRSIARPDAGRLNLWVLARVASQHGTTPDEVRQALFLR